ncbi:MAG: gliding motility-associated C-terminal domain-containing protein, partial [Saprospiraceae bacterium]|nr:gliding motility-associated C-terminal domain-containing protein [Saprospiraceae bacterium]
EIENPTILRQFQLFNNWQEGASRVNIADLNGDGQLEVSFVSYPRLYALRNNFTVMWTRNVNDASSITCSSIFDFCGDGSADVVYRDQDFLRIINGATGAVSWQDNCNSATHIEAPLILDVDADGQTEVVIQCGSDPNNLAVGTVVAYEAVGTPGITSRSVWNQHAYFNTNINDDLSVPQYQQNPNLVGDSLVLNTFMNQYFNPTFPSPDGAMTFQQVQCDGDSLIVTVEVCNTGDNILPPQTPISAYSDDPQTTPAIWVGTSVIGTDVALGQCQTVVFKIPRVVNDTVYLVLNDDHSQPTPFNLANDFPVTAIGECGFDNNLAVLFFPYAPDQISLGLDTAICDNTTFPLDASGNDLVNWAWSDGSSNSNFTVSTPGLYAVTVSDICNIQQIDSILVTIDSSTVVNIGIDQFMCKGEAVSFSESGFDFYNWTSGGQINCANCDTPTATPSSSTYIALEAGFSNGCVNRDTAFITVYDTFNYKVDTVICWGRKVTWNNIIIPPDSAVTFALQTIHGCDSTVLVNVIGTPVGTFNHVVDTSVCLGSTLPYIGFDLAPGDEKVFNLSAITGCDSTVLVKVAPRDTFYVEEYQTICFGDTYSIFGAPQNQSGTYPGNFTARNGCDSTHIVHLTVLPQIQLEIDAETACFGEANGSLAVLSPNGVEPLQYAWSPSNSNTSNVNNLPAGNYSLTVTDGNDCTETAQATVESYPSYSFTTNSDSVSCFGLSDGAINASSPDPTILFALSDGSFSQTGLFDRLPAGNYTVLAQDVFGCTDTTEISVDQPPLLGVNLPADTTIQLGVSLPLNIELSGFSPVQWIWSDTSYLSCISCPDPVSSPIYTIQYMLTIIDQNGCTATDVMILTVDPIVNVYIPNAMGGEGENARFEINFGPAVRKINMLRIYDRWGSLLHEAQNNLPGDSALGWDGRHNGALVAPGVYVWYLEVELVDGRIFKKKGDLTVVR